VAGGTLGYQLVSRNQEARKAFEDLQAQQDHLNVQLAAIDKKFGDLPDVRSQILEANKTLLALHEQAKKLELANSWENAVAWQGAFPDGAIKFPRPLPSDEVLKAIARGGPITYAMLTPPRWRETDQDDTRSWTREFNELRSAIERKDYALASLLARRMNAKRYPDLPENVFVPSRPGADSKGPFSIQE